MTISVRGVLLCYVDKPFVLLRVIAVIRADLVVIEI